MKNKRLSLAGALLLAGCFSPELTFSTERLSALEGVALPQSSSTLLSRRGLVIGCGVALVVVAALGVWWLWRPSDTPEPGLQIHRIEQPVRDYVPAEYEPSVPSINGGGEHYTCQLLTRRSDGSSHLAITFLSLPLTEAAFTPHLARVVAGEEEDGNPLRSVADEEADGNPMRDTLLNMRGDYIQHAHTIYLGTDDAVQLLVPIRNGVTEIQSLHGIMGSKVLPGHERKQLAISLVGLLQQINYPEHVSYARSTFDDLLFFRTQDGNFEVKYIPEVSITAYVYSQTNTTVAGGIIRLYAPEVWQGDVEQAPADIFSLGLILYPLLTGRSYAPTYQPKQLATAIRSGSAARAIINEVPELKDVFAALLAMNPADRFMDPAQIIQAINDYQD